MKPTFFASSRDFRAWLEAHHESERQLLVGYYKRGTGMPSLSWPESVDEALCFGWIDGVRKILSEDAYSVRFTPRKATTLWSALNVARVAALESLGRMTPAGRRALALRTPERTAKAAPAAGRRVTKTSTKQQASSTTRKTPRTAQRKKVQKKKRSAQRL